MISITTVPMPSSSICERVCSRKAAASCARFSSGVSSLAFSFGFCAAIAATFGGGGGKVMAPS